MVVSIDGDGFRSLGWRGFVFIGEYGSERRWRGCLDLPWIYWVGQSPTAMSNYDIGQQGKYYSYLYFCQSHDLRAVYKGDKEASVPLLWLLSIIDNTVKFRSQDF